MDSARKKERNRQWERAIGETRAEIEAAELDQNRRLIALMGINGEAQIVQEKSSHLIQRIPQRLIWNQTLRWAAAQEKERVVAGFQEWRGVPLELLQNLTHPELQEFLSNKYILYAFYGGKDCSGLVADARGRDLTAKKLRTQEWSMLKLVIRLLSNFPSYPDAAAASSNPVNCILPQERLHWKHVLEDSQRRLKMLKAEGRFSDIYDTFPSPTSPKYRFSPSEREEELKVFNLHLQEGLREVVSSSAVNLATICAKLLEMPTAPNIHTYNLLLVRFCQLGQNSLVHAIFESMQETHLRPNEITHTTMLRFFAATNDKIGFRRYVRMMSGFDQGLALANPDRVIHPNVRSRYRWFGRFKKAAEKARMNEDVYTALITGFLRFSRRNDAILYYEQMIREGWKPTVEILKAVLQDCYDTADSISGFQVFKLLRSAAINSSKVVQEAYGTVQKLCERCERWQLSRIIKRMRKEDDLASLTSPKESQEDNQEPIDSAETSLQLIRTVPRHGHSQRIAALDLAPFDGNLNATVRLKQVVMQHERTFEALALVMTDLTGLVSSGRWSEDTDMMKHNPFAMTGGRDQQRLTKFGHLSYSKTLVPADQQKCISGLQNAEKTEKWVIPEYSLPPIAHPFTPHQQPRLSFSA